MIYLHDLWVNWIEKPVNCLEVYEFHEWGKGDKILLVDQIPMVKVTEEFMDIIENHYVVLPDVLLDLVHEKAFIRVDRERKRLDYAVVLTDGKDRVIAIDTDGTDRTVFKSRLIPRQYNLALEMIEYRQVYDFELPEIIEESVYGFSDLIGLTRREKELKKIVLKGLHEVKERGNVEELRYYLSEIDPSNYKKIKKLDIDTCFNKIVRKLNKGWSSEHEELSRVFLNANQKYKMVFESIYNNSKESERV